MVHNTQVTTSRGAEVSRMLNHDWSLVIIPNTWNTPEEVWLDDGSPSKGGMFIVQIYIYIHLSTQNCPQVSDLNLLPSAKFIFKPYLSISEH